MSTYIGRDVAKDQRAASHCVFRVCQSVNSQSRKYSPPRGKKENDIEGKGREGLTFRAT